MEIVYQKRVVIKSFKVPNFVLIEDSPDNESVPLRDIPKETLEELCDEFRDAVMEKAGYL